VFPPVSKRLDSESIAKARSKRQTDQQREKESPDPLAYVQHVVVGGVLWETFGWLPFREETEKVCRYGGVGTLKVDLSLGR